MFQQFGGDGHFRFHSFVYVGIADCIRYIVCLDSLTDIYLQSQIDKIFISNDILLWRYSMICLLYTSDAADD